jgi:hypothetical protein
MLSHRQRIPLLFGEGTKSMKKGIAALVIAAAMISTPGALNASSFFGTTQWLYVFSQENPPFQHWSTVYYRVNGGNWAYVPLQQGNWQFQIDLVNSWLDAYVYDYTEGRLTDRMILVNIKQIH